jgi:C4-dicarboxylate-specific signal transduction histidine kinase
MSDGMRKTGVDVIGDMPWGTHFCLFYETKEDLIQTSVPYCRTGLESGEFVVWVVAEPLTVDEVTNALKDAVPDFDRYLSDSSIEISPAREWYIPDDQFDLRRVTAAWHEKLARASARGYAGVRVTGDTAWLRRKDWKDFCEYEEGLNEAVANRRLVVLCTYPLAACGAVEVLDVVRTHQFALAKRSSGWELIETAGFKQAKAEIKRLNEQLEQRVRERTIELMQTSDALRETQMELAHVNRVATMGQLAASITHEINQPISATIVNAHAGLRWLDACPPQLEEVRQALTRILRDGGRTRDVTGRMRALIKKAPPQKAALKINEAILEVMAVTRGEVVKNRVSVQMQLADGLPLIRGDRVQLQQVILNLIINAVEAMTEVEDGGRELLVATGQDASGAVRVAVQDTGPGLNSESLDRIFDGFYTTKPDGMGMGLSICRSIVESHGGRIWASRAASRGAILQLTLPVEGAAGVAPEEPTRDEIPASGPNLTVESPRGKASSTAA